MCKLSEERPDSPLAKPWPDPAVIDRVLFSRVEIAAACQRLAGQINALYAGVTEGTFTVVGLLTGCFMFYSDLVRNLTVPHTADFIACSSYGLDTVSAGNVQIKKDTNTSLAGKHVLLVDEMCDSGQTMASLVQLMRDRGALSVRSCVMFDKTARRASDLSPDLVGLVCPDEFVVGYGMDWANRFRSLPDVCVVRREAYAGK